MGATGQSEQHVHRLFRIPGLAQNLPGGHHSGVGPQHRAARIGRQSIIRRSGFVDGEAADVGFRGFAR